MRSKRLEWSKCNASTACKANVTTDCTLNVSLRLVSTGRADSKRECRPGRNGATAAEAKATTRPIQLQFLTNHGGRYNLVQQAIVQGCSSRSRRSLLIRVQQRGKMTTLGLLSPTSEPTASAASGTYHDPSPRRPLTPVIFAGPGSSLYPLCDPYSSSSADSLPKALLPLANRPLISLPLQQLVSAGLKHALVLASANQHRAIETALKGVRLHRPQVSSTSGFKSHLTPAQSSSNIVVVDGLSPAVNPASSKVKAFESAAIFVELLPLGPYDGKLAANLDDTENENSHHAEFRTTARPGTAELLRWLTSIGKLEVSTNSEKVVLLPSPSSLTN